LVLLYFIFVLVVSAILVSVIQKAVRGRIKKSGDMIQNSVGMLAHEGLVMTKKVSDFMNKYALIVDEHNEKWAVVSARTGSTAVYDYKDLLEFGILEDGDSIMGGRAGSVVAGGLLFGGLGALAGAAGSRKVRSTCRSIVVHIVTSNMHARPIDIPLLSAETRKDSAVYKNAISKAREFASVLAVIKNAAEERLDKNAQNAGDLEKMYDLMKKGILTEEEFSAKKAQLLGLTNP
jgi:hypothetical protein